MNPDTLREWANGEDCPVGSEWFIRAAADAWDDDIIAWCDTTVERDALRQRLEAAEALVRQYDGQAEKHLAEIATLAAGGQPGLNGAGVVWASGDTAPVAGESGT